MSELDRFFVFVIDDEEGARDAVGKELKATFTINPGVSAQHLEAMGIERDLVHVGIFKSQSEGAAAIRGIKKGDRFTCFLLDADLRKDGHGGTVTGGLSLWRELMEVIGEAHYEEFFATIYTKSGEVRAVLMPIFNFPGSRPVFLDFGETKIDISRVQQVVLMISDYFDRTSLSYALKGEFKAGPAFLHEQGEPAVACEGGSVQVRTLVRDDLRRLLASPIDQSFWQELGDALSGRRYHLEVNEGAGFYWTRRFNLAHLFPLETKAILDQRQNRRPEEDHIRTGLALIFNHIFPSVQAEFYEFCQFFDVPFDKMSETPKVVYNEHKKKVYVNIVADLISMFAKGAGERDSTRKLSHEAAKGLVGNLDSNDAQRIKLFLQDNFDELLHQDIYCMDYLRQRVLGLASGADLEALADQVKNELIKFPQHPARVLAGAVVDRKDNMLAESQISGRWNFIDFPLYWRHIHQLIKIFILNFERHNAEEFRRAGLAAVEVCFEQDANSLTLRMSVPGSVTDWALVGRSLQDATTPSCQIEKLSGFRKIACEYYGAELHITCGDTMGRATRSSVDVPVTRHGAAGSEVIYRVIFPKF